MHEITKKPSVPRIEIRNDDQGIFYFASGK